MSALAPLVLVEDDSDDRDIIEAALSDLGLNRQLVIFKDAEAALDYLSCPDSRPFLIISDVNMPRMDGFNFKATIENTPSLSSRNIPFVFLSTACSKDYVNKAFDLKAQGFFEKGSSYDKLKSSLQTILHYWEESKCAN